jgi:signal transduction histidine kinase
MRTQLDLKKRFKYITIIVLFIPLFAILITGFVFFISWSFGRGESDDLSAPRYLKPVLTEILTTGKVSKTGFSGIIMVLNANGELIYTNPKVEEFFKEQNITTFEDTYKIIMSRMPTQPFSVSVYRYKGNAGMVIFIEDFFTTAKIFKIIGTILFSMYLILIVTPLIILRRFMSPLAASLISLENAALEIAKGNLDVNVLKGRNVPKSRHHPTVLKNLDTAFETMRTELKENQERQSRIIMSISHDLKTPLTVIKGYVEALKDGMAETPDDIKEYADVIHERASLLEERITDLIHFSRLQTTDWQARFEPVGLSEFLTEASDIFKNDTFIRERQFESDLDIPSHISINGDRKMLFQVFENLFDNSCRYTETGDKIRLYTDLKQNEVVIIIEDSGPGIEKEHIPFIFNNFYRADSGRNTRGLGIGLDSAKIIIQNHGGEIKYRKSTMGGAGFQITLPIIED